MNTYRVEFFAKCPSNGVRIKYDLTIEAPAGRVLMAEHILMHVESLTGRPAFHEQLADHLARLLPGRQTLRAHHHGVDIETVREAAPHRRSVAGDQKPNEQESPAVLLVEDQPGGRT